MGRVPKRRVEAETKLTIEEARDLLQYHAVCASDYARGAAPEAAAGHAAAAQAMGVFLLVGGE